jgi:hypothetical protein
MLRIGVTGILESLLFVEAVDVVGYTGRLGVGMIHVYTDSDWCS